MNDIQIASVEWVSKDEIIITCVDETGKEYKGVIEQVDE